VDVWESIDAYQLFVESTLVPAMGKVAAAKGVELTGGPEQTVTEVHRLVR
jgi:hypothetical protein